MNFRNEIINFLGPNSSSGGSRTVQIQDNNFQFDVSLFNGETTAGITYGAIEDFQIIDDLRYFYSYGYIVFNDNHNVFEAFEGIDGQQVTPYTFRGDGRDYLNVEIMPQMEEDGITTSDSYKDEFCLKYTFAVYKIEDEIREDKGVRFKKLYFWDRDHQFLSEMDSHLSTAEVGFQGSQPTESKSNASTNVTNTSDFRRYTGDIIKYMLDKCLNQTAGVGFEASEEWDRGSTLLEYGTNGLYKAMDDLQYVMNYHLTDESTGNVPCILRKERYTGKYSYKPISSYLTNTVYSNGISKNSNSGGRYMTEDFFIGKIDTADGTGMGGPKSGNVNASNAFNAINYNTIDNYSILKSDAEQLQKQVTSHLIYSYDPQGFFTCKIKDNNFQSIIGSIFNWNVKKVGGAHDIMPKNKLREENKNLVHTYASGIGEDSQKLNFGRNQGLMMSVFKNNALYFRARGLTRRQAGAHFTLNRRDNAVHDTYDNQLLGDYFTTMVVHDFKKGMYYNHIYAIKSATEQAHPYANMT
jgi:hypothetical protein